MSATLRSRATPDIARAMKVSYSRTRQLLAAAFAKLGLESRDD